MLETSNTPSVRVFEVHGPEDWNRLCVRYPAKGTKDGPPDPEWLVPDWGAAAAEWDGVHVSLGGLLTTEQVRYESTGGVSMLLFTESELTYWLRGFPSLPESCRICRPWSALGLTAHHFD